MERVPGIQRRSSLTSTTVGSVGESSAGAAGCQPPTNGDSGSSNQVLLVTDHETDRLLIRELLTEFSYSVVVAASDPAIHIIERCYGSLQLVVTDLFQPGRHGLTLVESIAAYWSKFPILLLIDHPNDLATWQVLEEPITAAICRPITRIDLMRGISAARQIRQTLKRRLEHSAALRPDVANVHEPPTSPAPTDPTSPAPVA